MGIYLNFLLENVDDYELDYGNSETNIYWLKPRGEPKLFSCITTPVEFSLNFKENILIICFSINKWHNIEEKFNEQYRDYLKLKLL